MKSQERLRMNEAMSEKTMAEDIEQSEEREEEFNNVSEEMFNSTWEGDDDDTRQNSSIHLGVAYQTISADVSELKDKTNISEMMKRRIVSKIKKSTRYGAPEIIIEENIEEIRRSGINVNFIKEGLIKSGKDAKFPVNLQYIERDDDEHRMLIKLSDTVTSMNFMVSKRYRYIFETKMAKLNTILTIQELKKDRATNQWIITFMKIDKTLQVNMERPLGNPVAP